MKDNPDTNEAGRPLKEIAKQMAEHAYDQAGGCENVGKSHYECIEPVKHIETALLSAMKAALERVKGDCDWHDGPSRCGKCMWCAFNQVIDKEIEALQ